MSPAARLAQADGWRSEVVRGSIEWILSDGAARRSWGPGRGSIKLTVVNLDEHQREGDLVPCHGRERSVDTMSGTLALVSLFCCGAG